MAFQRFCHRLLLTSGLVLSTAGLQPALAESFSFSLNGLGITETPEGDRTFSGSLTFDGAEMSESQIIDFDLTHGDHGDEQSLEMGLRNQGESILEAVFDLFGLNARGDGSKLDANVSGDIDATESDIDVSLGQNMPGMRINIRTPQGTSTP